jgi:heavy metal translocating P-type ATPase
VTLPRAASVTLAIAIAALVAIAVEGGRQLGLFPGLPPGASVIALAVTGFPLVLRTAQEMLRGRFSGDIVASLAIATALALAQPLAGLVVVLMQSGGELLEHFAEARASRAVRALEEAAPRIAHRQTARGLEEVPVDSVREGDLLLVRPGEMVPCDGSIVEGTSHLNTASITGEPVPRSVAPGAQVLSGSYNQESPLTLRVSAPAAASQYARIVDLVRNAQASQAPLQRLADRYAAWFTPVTLAVAGLGYAISGDPDRVLSVLVVATPCPLILAVPVAIIGGVNRGARRGIIVRNGTALEQIGEVDLVVFDKTGTLTIGRPRVARVVPAPGQLAPDVLRLAAAVEHHSSHLLARAVVEEAEEAAAILPEATDVVETAGRGVRGKVEGHDVAVGAQHYVLTAMPEAARLASLIRPGVLTASIAIDGQPGGIVEYEDRIRPETREALARVDALGIRRTILLSGDSQGNADSVATALGIGEARGNLLAEDKVATVERLRAEGHGVLVVGDGTNDAPALEAALVGVAIAPREAAIAAEAADIVLLADDLRLLPTAIEIGRRSLRIARQSIWAGLGLSAVAMVFAAAGFVRPTIGALLQELIDVAVILNALRSAREPRERARDSIAVLPAVANVVRSSP